MNQSIAPRRRLRAQEMAEDLNVSIRKFREFITLGMPLTQLQGIQWFEPERVHAWLDKFNRKGSPGVKRVRGIKVAEVPK